jgi:hypothetical protein
MPSILRIVIVALWLVPLRFLVPFMAVALYSAPETDDYCLSAHDPWTALAHIHQYYMTVSGRLPALVLMATPSVIAGKLGMDFIVLYPLVNLGMICGLIAATTISAWRLIRSDWTVNVLFGLILSAIVIGLNSDLREFVYWLTGAACYLMPTLGSLLVAAYMSAALARGESLSRGAFVVLLLICSVSSASNEFTGLFLVGVVVLSCGFQYLALGRKRVQVGMHAWLLIMIVAGFAVVALAPGSGARMGQLPRSQDIPLAIETVRAYVPQYLRFLGTLQAVWWAPLSAICFGCVAAWPSGAPDRRITLLFVAALIAMTMVWVCTAYFIGAFATGELIPLRSRNEIWATVEAVGMMAGVLVAGAVVQNRLTPLATPVLAAIGTVVVLSLSDAPASSRMSEAWPELATFWRETRERHLLLTTTTFNDVVVPRRSVTPSLLMEEELKEQPDRLPNDCVATFYGKRTVVLAPR